MRICYIDKNFRAPTLERIAQANEIIVEYQEMGLDLTLRQLYYQFVSRDLIPNRQNEYKKLGDIINDGRLAGLIPWDAIVDRTRFTRSKATWDSPLSILNAVCSQYRIDRWEGQPSRPEVWIEKDALVGAIESACFDNYVDYFSCRGYPSQSAIWKAGQRFREMIDNGQEPVVIHLGDHDPSGMDMTRDIEDRLSMFCEQPVTINRIALNMDQVRQYNPPPNPAKETDTRSGPYVAKYGHSSWELDALDPKTLQRLIIGAIEDCIEDPDVWEEVTEREQKECAQLEGLRKHLR